MVIYEWGDVDYLGKVTSVANDLPVSLLCHRDAKRVQANEVSRKHTSAPPMQFGEPSVTTLNSVTLSLIYQRANQSMRQASGQRGLRSL